MNEKFTTEQIININLNRYCYFFSWLCQRNRLSIEDKVNYTKKIRLFDRNEKTLERQFEIFLEKIVNEDKKLTEKDLEDFFKYHNNNIENVDKFLPYPKDGKEWEN